MLADPLAAQSIIAPDDGVSLETQIRCSSESAPSRKGLEMLKSPRSELVTQEDNFWFVLIQVQSSQSADAMLIFVSLEESQKL